jgi:hypothetical protein
MSAKTRKDKFLADINQTSIDSETDLLTEKCKFNFAYFVKQPAGQSFEEWDVNKLHKLLNKLKDYSQASLSHWKCQPIGAHGKVLAIYGNFPTNSDFTFPKHIPHQAEWGRFRLESAVRLVGFILPSSYDGKEHPQTKMRFDCNTFYVVFLDANHKFYKTEK